MNSADLPIEYHPLIPFLPKNATVLMCGTFPPAKNKWSMEFYYPNFINDMWRIFGLIFHSDKNYFVDIANKSFKIDKIKNLLNEHKIALSDTAKIVQRQKGNASDKFLKVIEPFDLKGLLNQIPNCRYLVTTGEKAASIVAEMTNSNVPDVGKSEKININIGELTIPLTHYRMPSSSRAYPMKLEQKAEFYRKMMSSMDIFKNHIKSE